MLSILTKTGILDSQYVLRKLFIKKKENTAYQ